MSRGRRVSLLQSRRSTERPSGPAGAPVRASGVRAAAEGSERWGAVFLSPPTPRQLKKKSGEGGREPARSSYRRASGLRGIGQLRKGRFPLVMGWALVGSLRGEAPRKVLQPQLG